MSTSAASSWPPLHVVLYEPDIPPNTGNIARLCAGTGAVLHLIEPLGFRLNDRTLKRAGLDYWQAVRLERHRNLDAFFEQVAPANFHLFSTKARHCYTDAVFQPHDALVFGSETRGLPEELLERFAEKALTIPMQRQYIRSLNLANAASIALYEALRQIRCR